MEKEFFIITPDGMAISRTGKLSLKAMQEIVGGYIERVTVLDRIADNGGYIYTTMYVNEDGLGLNLPRNEVATAIYQRNIRAQYPGHPNPFRAAQEAFAKQHAGMTVISMGDQQFDDDPYICGTVIYFGGWTRDEVEKAGY